MSAMGESRYLLSAHSGQNGHSNQSPQDSTTPYSAVSSFNLPPYCDSSLITPVSMTQSSPMASTPASVLKIENESEKDIKLSPSEMSPSFQFMSSDDDYQPKYLHNPPMKYKNSSGTLHASSADSAFPISPFTCPEPFWGAYGVSATPVSLRSESSPSGNPSPRQLHSAGGLSNSSSSYSRQQTSPQKSTGYRSSNPPILIAPSPMTLRPATNSSQQNSLRTFSTTPSSATMGHAPFPEPLGTLPPRGKKRKSPSRDSQDRAMVLRETDKADEILLLDLTHRQRTPWKQVIDIFKDRFGLECTESRLQMRKKRLIDRLRRWTAEDKHALTLAVEELGTTHWDQISEAMLKYGCGPKWPKEACQKQWQEMHPQEGPWFTQYNDVVEMKYRDSGDWSHDEDAFSDSHTSGCHSLQEGDSGVLMSAVSAITMDESRSRATSDASLPMIHHRSQHQRNGWEA